MAAMTGGGFRGWFVFFLLLTNFWVIVVFGVAGRRFGVAEYKRGVVGRICCLKKKARASDNTTSEAWVAAKKFPK
jgi:hypothetical protein